MLLRVLQVARFSDDGRLVEYSLGRGVRVFGKKCALEIPAWIENIRSRQLSATNRTNSIYYIEKDGRKEKNGAKEYLYPASAAAVLHVEEKRGREPRESRVSKVEKRGIKVNSASGGRRQDITYERRCEQQQQ